MWESSRFRKSLWEAAASALWTACVGQSLSTPTWKMPCGGLCTRKTCCGGAREKAPHPTLSAHRM